MRISKNSSPGLPVHFFLSYSHNFCFCSSHTNHLDLSGVRIVMKYLMLIMMRSQMTAHAKSATDSFEE
jgi:hypothetical protein